MELANGSRIEALPGTEKTIRGFSGVNLLLVDEASRVDDALYFAVRPMLAISGGRLLLLTTPFGRRGIFYEEWTGDGAWERYEVPARCLLSGSCPKLFDVTLRASQYPVDHKGEGVGADLGCDPGGQPHQGGCQRLAEAKYPLQT
jgi:hypothetical protein